MPSPRRRPEPVITVGLLLTLAVQNAVPPFATDMYSPAFPRVAADLATSASAVGLTLTAFFVGMALGQVVGGATSDQLGRRVPMVIGGVVCMVGAIVCALSPAIAVLLVGRLLQGLGGGAAAVVGRAVLVDLVHGKRLAAMMSILMAVGALAPMIAPVAGGAVLSVSSWRAVFWCLTGFGSLMVILAVVFVPESLPAEQRQTGGMSRFAIAARGLVAHRSYMGYMLVSTFSSFAMFAYISSSSFVLQEIKGLRPMTFSLFFAGTAGSQMLLSVLNARLVRRVRPRILIGVGLSVSTLGALIVTTAVLALDVALIPVCTGFLLLMGAQAFVFGNASALALGQVRGAAGAASAVLGVAQAIGNATSAPLASSGGGASAIPMVVVMVVGVAGAWACHLLVGRARQASDEPLSEQ